MLIGMVLETLGIGLVLPALALMTQSDLAIRYPSVAPLIRLLGSPNHERLVVIGMFTLVGTYAIKTLFLAFLSLMQMRFVYGVQADLSQRLFTNYLHQPYTFHLQRNSAQLIRNAITETTLFTNTGLIGTLFFLTEGLVLLGISILLIAVEPLGALLVVSTLGAAAWAFNHATRDRILTWGIARQVHEGMRIQYLQEALGGIKEVLLLGRERDFMDRYGMHNAGNARVGERQATLQQMPRLGLELLAVSGLAALVVIMIWRGRPLEALLPTLGLFAAAAFRLIPSTNRAINSLQQIRFALPVIDILHREIRSLPDMPPVVQGEAIRLQASLVLDDVHFSYPAAESPALRGVSLTVPRGSSVGFVGTTGAGKSTLVDIILGLLSPGSGTVRVDGVDIGTNRRGWQDQIGYVPQSIFLTDDTLRRNVAFGLPQAAIDDDAVWRAVRAAQLEQFVKELPKGLDTMVGERGARLSGGQRQRLGIARALYHNPSALILDEATSSLDTETERDVMEAVRALQGDKTLIIVAHRLSTVEHCDRIFRIDGGRVVDEDRVHRTLGKASAVAG